MEIKSLSNLYHPVLCLHVPNRFCRVKTFHLDRGILHCKKCRNCSHKQTRGTGLEFETTGIDIWWKGIGVVICWFCMQGQMVSPVWESIRCFSYSLWCQLHRTSKTQKLLNRVRWDLRLIASIFPNTKLVRSFMLPRVAWCYSRNVRAMEQTRNRINRAAAKEIQCLGESS